MVLDRLRQGYNIGALFRLCDLFLYEALVICSGDSSPEAREDTIVPCSEPLICIMSADHLADEGYEVLIAEMA